MPFGDVDDCRSSLHFAIAAEHAPNLQVYPPAQSRSLAHADLHVIASAHE
jgi:hypothetical protein